MRDQFIATAEIAATGQCGSHDLMTVVEDKVDRRLKLKILRGDA